MSHLITKNYHVFIADQWHRNAGSPYNSPMKIRVEKLRLILIAGAAVAIVVLIGCGRKPATDPSPGQGQASGTLPAAGQARGPGSQNQGVRRFSAIPVQAVVINEGVLSAQHDTAGSVVPVTQSPVATQVGGIVSRTLLMAGDWVKAGQIVVQLDDTQLKLNVQSAQLALQNAKINLTVGEQNTSLSTPTLQAQLQAAEAALDSAQKNYNSQKALFDQGGVSASALDAAKSQLSQAQANVQNAKTALEQNKQADTQSIAQLRLAVDQASNQLAQAELNLQNASIKAPFAGQIAAVNVTPGSYVSPNTPVFVLVSADRQIDFNVPPSDAPALKVGMVVQFILEGRNSPVRILQAPSAPIGGVVPMVATIPAGSAFPFGAVGTVTYSLGLARGALIPVSSLQTNENQDYVFTIVGGKAVIQPITVIAETGITAAVAGISAGTQVIVSPPPGLLSGSAVQPVGGAAAQGSQPPGSPQAQGSGQRGAGGR